MQEKIDFFSYPFTYIFPFHIHYTTYDAIFFLTFLGPQTQRLSTEPRRFHGLRIPVARRLGGYGSQ